MFESEQLRRPINIIWVTLILAVIVGAIILYMTNKGYVVNEPEPGNTQVVVPEKKAIPVAPPSAPLTENDKQTLSDLQTQINEGKISSEEAIKKINAINARLQAEVKK